MTLTTVPIPRVFGGVLIIQVDIEAPTAPLVLSVSFASPQQRINATFAASQEHIQATFTEVAMTTPNTTIDSSATVKDQNGVLITNLSAYTLSVTYQDGTTAAPAVSNVGSGVYTASYNTKGVGVLTELWSFTGATGAIASDQRTLIIAY